ncbi:MAG: DUF4160 domain-containing protein [Chloroflexota bacterium]
MPEVSRFLGIGITMYFRDHPPPHFHVRYGEYRAVVSIESPTLLQGILPPRVYGLVIEWATLYHNELIENWNLSKSQLPIQSIPPLE